MVTDRLIGHRFGYGVLGRYYSKRLWEQGCFDDMEEESGHAHAPLAGHPVEDGSLQETQAACEDVSHNVGSEEERERAAADAVDGEAGPARPEARCLNAEVEHGEGGPEEASEASEGHREGQPAASTTSATEGSAAARPGSTESAGRVGTGVLTGSRQTSLAHWLL